MILTLMVVVQQSDVAKLYDSECHVTLGTSGNGATLVSVM